MKILRLLPFLLLTLLWHTSLTFGQAKTKASVVFDYVSNPSAPHYNQRVLRKTIPLQHNALVMLTQTATNTYAVEKYSSDLKKQWSTELKLAEGESLEAFYASSEVATVVTHQASSGKQQLIGHQVNLSTGKKQASVPLLEAPATTRRASVVASADGSKLLAYRYHTDARHQIQDISGTLYDGKLQKLQDTQYHLQDIPAILSVDVQLGNSGEQYINLISDNMKRLTTRQYTLGSKEARVMSVLVGGTFDGRKVYIMDSKFKLMPNGKLFGAVLTANEASGEYYSLKAVKFDYEAEDMIFAEEFRFMPEYLAKVNALDKRSTPKPELLEDIYLSDLVLTPEEKLIVLAEKKYTSGGKDAPFFTDELHVFAYDEYMDSAWNGVLMKHQQAPAQEGFSSISFSSSLDGTTLNLLTLEKLNGKTDLYLRQLNTTNGTIAPPKTLDLQIADTPRPAYVKDFTAWLSGKELVTVVRPAKNADKLRLLLVQLK
ncbi:hypothetical protein ACXYMU_17720 [Pontibacter sp. CAU 1760]